jgi:hypothetical protein
MSVADGRALPWRVLGRIVKPYALAVSFATVTASAASWPNALP